MQYITSFFIYCLELTLQSHFEIDFEIAYLKLKKGKMQVQRNVFGCKLYNLIRAFKVMLFLRYKMDTYCIL